MRQRGTKDYTCDKLNAGFGGMQYTSGVMTNLWLYWTATFIGTSIVALSLRKKSIH
jgi:hypothetical protein